MSKNKKNELGYQPMPSVNIEGGYQPQASMPIDLKNLKLPKGGSAIQPPKAPSEKK